MLDVAKHAGVSQTTVSRVINGDPLVKERTREKVNQSIEDLRYQPNIAARSLAGRKAAKIGVVFERPYGGYTGELLLSALRECSQRSHMLLGYDAALEDDKSTVLDIVKAHVEDVDAIILPPLRGDKIEVAKWLKSRSIPTIALSGDDERLHEVGWSTVGIDDFQAAMEMTNRLIEAGHKRVAFIRGLDNQPDGLKRFEGYLEAVNRAGLETSEGLCPQGDFSMASGVSCMRQLVESGEKPTAIFAANDDMAAGALGYAVQAGITVPTDMSVVGFDDSPLAEAMTPKLTTVRQPINKIISTALNVLEELLQADGDSALVHCHSKARHLVHPHRFIDRGSFKALNT